MLNQSLQGDIDQEQDVLHQNLKSRTPESGRVSLITGRRFLSRTLSLVNPYHLLAIAQKIIAVVWCSCACPA